MRGSSAAVLLAVLVLAGCGGSHDDSDAQKAATIPAYGQFPAMTVPVTPGTPAFCRAKAEAFSRAAEGFLRPFPSDADNYRVLARVQFVAFQARRCDTEILREAFARRLTPKQRREVLMFFGFLGDVAGELAAARQR